MSVKIGPSTRMFTSLLVARAVFGLVFLGAALRPIPLLWYLPLERAWSFEVSPPGFAMAWFGLTGLALACSLTAGLGAYAASGQRAVIAWLSRPGVMLALARAGALILLVDFLYFGWTMSHQTPSPLPLPSWYCPR